MGVPFNADEVFEMAEQIERNGAKFYRMAAEKFPAMRELLLDLAAMEDKHEKTFAAMRAEFSAAELEQPVFDPDGQAQMYLRAIADGRVFDVKADPAQKLAGRQTPRDVLRLAIDMEKDSIVFYNSLKEFVSPRAGKDKVGALIMEEIGHIVILDGKLQALK